MIGHKHNWPVSGEWIAFHHCGNCDKPLTDGTEKTLDDGSFLCLECFEIIFDSFDSLDEKEGNEDD